MKSDQFSQFSETDTLKKVIIGRWEHYAEDKRYIELVNEDQKKGLPTRESLKEDLETFGRLLRKYGVEVLVPQRVGRFVYDQLTPRDIGVTIGDRFVICNMARSSRRYEVAGIFDYLNRLTGPKPEILIPEEQDILLEGGDILIDKERIFVGLSQRTNPRGAEFLHRHFGEDFDVIPVRCKSIAEGKNVLHLDCTMNIVGRNHVIIYPDGFAHLPEILKTEYQWLEVNESEQRLLATNVLSVNREVIISRKHRDLQRVNRILRENGFTVEELAFDAVNATGGSFRCASLPLVRA